MNIIDAQNLDPAYRLYQTSGGRYVRVKIETVPNKVNVFKLTAQSTDEDGILEGFELEPVSIRLSSDQVDVAPITDETDTNLAGAKGQLIRVTDRLYEHDGVNWVDRGPIDPSAAPAAAEALTAWDKTARELVTCTDRAAERYEVLPQLQTAIGETP